MSEARELANELESIYNEREQMLMQCSSASDRVGERHRAAGATDALITAALTAAKAEGRREGWVPVETGLPESQRMVLAFTPYSEQAIHYCWLDFTTREFMEITRSTTDQIVSQTEGQPVTYWRYLPDTSALTPTEGEEE